MAEVPYPTTGDLADLAGVNRRTILRWVRYGLLPERVCLSSDGTGVHARYPRHARELVREVVELRASGLSLEATKDVLDRRRQPSLLEQGDRKTE